MKERLIRPGSVLAAAGQDDFTRGHVSVRLPQDASRFYMKAQSTGLDEITPDNILTIALDGEVVAGTARRHSEVFIHSEIYKAREDVALRGPHPSALCGRAVGGRPAAHVRQPAGCALSRGAGRL